MSKSIEKDLLIVGICLIATAAAVADIRSNESLMNNMTQLASIKEQEKPVQFDAKPSIATLDVEQILLDAKGKTNITEWINKTISQYCAKNCTILTNNLVVGGSFLDLNQKYRDEFGISQPAQNKPEEDQKTLAEFFEKSRSKIKEAESSEKGANADLEELKDLFNILGTQQEEEKQ